MLQSEQAESLAKIEKERVSVQAKIAEEQRQAKEQNQKDREHAQAQIALERQFHQEKVDAAKNAIEAQKQNLQALFREARQDHPELASAIADIQYRLDTNVIDYLLHKQRPAIKAAEEIRKLASEKRDLIKENRQLQYQLDFYEQLLENTHLSSVMPIEMVKKSITYPLTSSMIKSWCSKTTSHAMLGQPLKLNVLDSAEPIVGIPIRTNPCPVSCWAFSPYSSVSLNYMEKK